MPEDTPGTTKKTKRRARNLLIDLITLAVIIVIAIFVMVLIGQGGEQSASSSTTINLTGLHCEKSDPTYLYFEKPAPESGLQEVRANFDDEDNLTDLSYSFTATYSAGTDLSQARTNAHASFDLDRGNAYVHADNSWSETFSILDSQNAVKFTVYSEAKFLKASVAEVFQLPANEQFPKTKQAVKTAYEKQGFTCMVSE